MADADRTYTETEHLALMADAVTRETAELTSTKADLEKQISEKAARVDVLEGEKTALETKVADAEKALADYKADIERLAEIAKLRDERKDAVKAANAALPDAYFTDERVQAWAEMDEATFAIVVDGLKALAGSTGEKAKETAAFAGGESPTDTGKPTTGSFLAARRGQGN